jgi:Chaperone of endosialidase
MYATIPGGFWNFAIGGYSTVAGGSENEANGAYSFIAGGSENITGGSNSLAAGRLAYATGNGDFVWSDDSGVTTATFQNNQYMARASGGVIFLTGTQASPSSYASGMAGVALQPGATSWSTISDRNAKKNFKPVDTMAVLDKLAAVPIEQWNYKWEKDSDTPNIGPMAQDFKHAFYPGRTDTSINTLEFDGVELAAIQGLNQKLNEQRAENSELKQELDELKAEVKSLEQRN